MVEEEDGEFGGCNGASEEYLRGLIGLLHYIVRSDGGCSWVGLRITLMKDVI